LFSGFVCLALLSYVVVRRLDGFVRDDALIYYRYAANIANGYGWTFNVGQHTDSAATSPLWTLMLAVAYWIRPSMDSNATALVCACTAVGALVTFATLRRLVAWPAGAVAAVLLVLNPWLLPNRGMESSLFVALFSIAVFFVVARPRPVVFGVAAALLTLTRPEGLILLVGVLGMWLLVDRRRALLGSAGAGGVLLPWAGYAWIEFGSVVPSSARGKLAQGRSGFFGGDFAFVDGVRSLLTSTTWFPSLLVLGVVGIAVFAARRPLWGYLGCVVVVPAIGFLAYAVLRPAFYEWYLVPQHYALTVSAALGVYALGSLVESATGDRDGRAVAAVLLIGVAALVVVGLRALPHGYPYDGYDAAIGTVVRASPPDATVANAEIGVFGWKSGRRMIDYLGLLDDQAATDLSNGNLSQWLARTHPSLFVTHVPTWNVERPAIATREFERSYAPLYETHVGKPPGHVRVFSRSTDAGGSLVTPRVTRAFRDAGVDLGQRDRVVLSSLILLDLIDPAAAAAAESGHGIDFLALLQWARQHRSDAAYPQLGEAAAVIDHLHTALDGKAIVSPLA
jgi:hypothetical protein